jgi:hypothetical protein
MPVQRKKNTYVGEVQLSSRDELNYRLVVEKSAHPTWTFRCEHRPFLESDQGVPKNEYRWSLPYKKLDAAEDSYEVSLAFLGPTKYHLFVTKKPSSGASETIQDIEYSLDDGTDYYVEALILKKSVAKKKRVSR